MNQEGDGVLVKIETEPEFVNVSITVFIHEEISERLYGTYNPVESKGIYYPSIFKAITIVPIEWNKKIPYRGILYNDDKSIDNIMVWEVSRWYYSAKYFDGKNNLFHLFEIHNYDVSSSNRFVMYAFTFSGIYVKNIVDKIEDSFFSGDVYHVTRSLIKSIRE